MSRRHAPILVLVAGAALLLASPALAQLPSPSTSTVPDFIRLVGSSAGVPDSVAGGFSMVIRDLAYNPYKHAYVLVDFSGCPDLRIASDQLNPNDTVDCANHRVGAFTNAAGVVSFTLIGSSRAAGSCSGVGCGRVYADGALMRYLTVAAFDLDGAGGVNSADISVWLADLGLHVYRGRSDFDGSGSITTADLSVMLTELGTHRSSVTLAACP